MPNEKITEFKFNMDEFGVVDKVDLFKQTSEMICFDLIRTSVSRDKLQRDFKRLEKKLKTKSAEKKALLIKKSELEKKIKEMSKGKWKETLNSLIVEKDAEIQSMRKKLKIPHDAHVEIAELKVVLQEKQALETKLQDIKVIAGTFQN